MYVLLCHRHCQCSEHTSCFHLYDILLQAFLFYDYILNIPILLLVVSYLLYNELSVPSILAAVLNDNTTDTSADLLSYTVFSGEWLSHDSTYVCTTQSEYSTQSVTCDLVSGDNRSTNVLMPLWCCPNCMGLSILDAPPCIHDCSYNLCIQAH